MVLSGTSQAPKWGWCPACTQGLKSHGSEGYRSGCPPERVGHDRTGRFRSQMAEDAIVNGDCPVEKESEYIESVIRWLDNQKNAIRHDVNSDGDCPF